MGTNNYDDRMELFAYIEGAEAFICLQCGVIHKYFDWGYCPKCSEVRSSVPINTWLGNKGICEKLKEERNVRDKLQRETSDYSLQENTQDVLDDTNEPIPFYMGNSQNYTRFAKNQSLHPSNGNQRTNQEESSKSEISESDNKGRIRGESESYLQKGGDWINASYARIWSSFRRNLFRQKTI